MSKKKPDVLKTLQAARHHIDTKWVHGAWFKYVDNNSDDAFDTGDSVPDGATVVGICAAGSVLYALDYTSERWINTEKVKPVIVALYEALPERSRAKRETIADLAYAVQNPNPTGTEEATAKYVYDKQLDAVIEYNDSPSRRKSDILALFDRAIENVQAATPITIQEQAL